MKKILSLMFSLSTLFGCKSQAKTIIQKLDVITFKEVIKKGNVQLIDVRTPYEYQQGHIKNAKPIDFFANDFKEKTQQLDKERPVYLYCRSGNRSGKASKILNELGFKEIYDLKGGFIAWSRQN
ncbi:MAG: rhodanese-like domain-containing protein [Cellulophaga sp.]